MKTHLDINQMRELKELGVDTTKASMVLMFFTDEGEELSWDQVEDHGKEDYLWEYFNEETEIWESATIGLFDAETGDYDHSYRERCGVFTLQDMIEMLPTHLDLAGEDTYCYLVLNSCDGEWMLGYNKVEDDSIATGFMIEDNIIDAVYNAMYELAGLGYFKKERS